MNNPCLKTLAVTILLGAVLTACGSTNPKNPNGTATTYTSSTDTHPCLSVGVAAPDVIKLGTETTIRVEVNNRCNEATTYTSSTPPYFLQLVNSNNKIVWFKPETITSLPSENTVAENGTTSYDVAVMLLADSVPPGTYRMIANLFVDQDTGPDATQYVKPLRLESEPENVSVPTSPLM